MNITDGLIFFMSALIGFGIGCAMQAAKLAGARQLLAKAQNETASATTYAAALKQQVETLAGEKQALADELALFRDKSVSLAAREDALKQRLTEQQAELVKMQEQLKLSFKDTAATMLEEISAKFTVQSEKKIGDLLNPMQQHLSDFKKLVTDSFTTQGQEQHTLKAVIEKIVLQTDGLSKALRGDVKAQGNWGEVMLERILEESGLRKDEDYVLQGIDMGLISADGSRQQPDVIVKLPENKHIIIDAKVSLTSYDRYSSENDPAVQELHLREFLKSIKAHVNGLEQRRYQDNAKLGTPDFVLMFMPIEGAYSLAVQQDRELHSYAWGKRIVIVCPATLFATLRTVASLWSIERQNKHAQEIATEAGKMYDKFVGFIDDMNRIGQRIGMAQASYDEAMGKLSKGTGNLVGRAEKLKDYGVKSNKSLFKVIKNNETNDEEMVLAEAVEG